MPTLCSQTILKLMEHFPLAVVLGAGLLGWLAGEMVITDPVLKGWSVGWSLAAI